MERHEPYDSIAVLLHNGIGLTRADFGWCG